MSRAAPSNRDTHSSRPSLSTPRDRIAVARDAFNRLQQSPYSALRKVSCNYHEGVITRRGQLPSYYLKQVAQALLLKTPGIEEINNRIEVIVPVRSGGPTTDRSR